MKIILTTVKIYEIIKHMKLGTLLINGQKFRLPCVYEFLLDGTVLYVGYSGVGFARVFYKSNGLITPNLKSNSEGRRQVAFNKADQIRVTVFDNAVEAKTEELRLIRLHQPVCNVLGKRGKAGQPCHQTCDDNLNPLECEALSRCHQKGVLEKSGDKI